VSEFAPRPHVTDEIKERFARGQELYEYRNKIARILYRVPLEDLKRLHAILVALSDDDMRSVARFAEGLAEWPDPGSSSGNGCQEQTR
jgi:hypothetical protein